jgi:hypothetical protein
MLLGRRKTPDKRFFPFKGKQSTVPEQKGFFFLRRILVIAFQ